MNNLEINFKNHDITTPYFKLIGLNTYGRLVDIHDGDTCKIVLPVMNSYYKFNVRLNGIDTCEITSHHEENKNKAQKARNKICSLIQEKWGNNEKYTFETQKEIKEYLKSITCIVFVKCYDFDKYGRLLADVYINYDDNDNVSKSLSEILISEHLAYRYDGGKKLPEQEQLF